MNRIYSRGRLATLAAVIALLAVIYGIFLYKLQIIEGDAYYEASMNNIVSTETVSGARGSIMDRYGRVLVTNRSCSNLVIDETELFYTDGVDANASILQMCALISEHGDTWNDELPVTMTTPFEYTDMTDAQAELLHAWMDTNGLDYDADAVELMAAMRSRYGVDASCTAEEARIIVGVRYAVNVRYLINTSDYIFAEDVSMELIAAMLEKGMTGFNVQTSYVREYNTYYAAHLLGYIRQMDAEQLETYSALGYSTDAKVGQEGAEYAFESYLHGSDGVLRTVNTADGVVTDTSYLTEPEPGSHVYLTIDIGLQEVAENSLNSYITSVNAEREENNLNVELYGGTEDDIEQLIKGGAVVAVDIATGEPLAIASWPTYDISSLLESYTDILEAENEPLFNRALNGTYAPGSTFKPVTAIAACASDIITPNTTIECTGIYDKYEYAGYAPACWIYSSTGNTHGVLNLTQAITHSCNIYFYTISDYMGIDIMSEYAAMFGLGESTGIELTESLGHMSTPEYKYELYGDTGEDAEWHIGDTLQSGIGQMYTEFTPLQMAEYCAALANNGTRHSASILKSVRSYDYSESLYEREAEVMSTVETEQEYYDAVHLGMREVVTNKATNPTVYNAFYGADYTVAAKTGTAQMGESETNNAVFMCYAPYENPEIAVAVVVERGSAGASAAVIARDVLDYYFSFKDSAVALEGENELLK